MNRITQQTFDEVVRENMEEFSMSAEEAMQDAIKQFEAQGIDLTNIVKDAALSSSAEGVQPVVESMVKLKQLLESDAKNRESMVAELNCVKSECDKDLSRKLLAGEQGAYAVLLQLLNTAELEEEVRLTCLAAMTSLMTGQPDLLTDAGIQFMVDCLAGQMSQQVVRRVLRWMRECCIKHEQNRQNIFNAKVTDHLKPLLQDGDVPLLKDVCGVLRALVLDDDVRVEFGKAHEHARAIAAETLGLFTSLLTKHKEDETAIEELLCTLAATLVRSEYCKQVDESGGLTFILQVLKDFPQNEKLNRQALKLLKVLAGNDDCKAHIIQAGGEGARIIGNALLEHKGSAPTAAAALGCLAALALRSPENSEALFQAGLPETIVECMRLHPNNLSVQKGASWAVRNMVSRSRHLSAVFLSLGVEELLRRNMGGFPQAQCEYDFKAALRDLGCQVNFKEEWTGKGGRLNSQHSMDTEMQEQ